MARILVVPERMLDLSQQMRREADRLREIESSLGRALGGLEWEVRHRSNVEGQVQAARGQARALAERAEQMARFLAERATAFQQADAEGAQSLGAVTEPYLRSVPTPVPTPSPPPGPSPWDLVRIEPWEQRVLLEWGADTLISRLEPLGLLKDLLDVARLPAWQRRVDEARQAWETALRRSGSRSPQAQEAYGRYVETMIFEMPLLGDRARALVALLNILGRMHPVE